MAASTSMISGLASGFDWRSMIDQLIEIEHGRVDLVEDKKSEYESKLEIFQSMNTKLLSFKTQAETLASSDAFNIYTSSLSTDSPTYTASELASVSTTTSAGPGSHTISMSSTSTLAEARKLSSKSFSDYDTALSLEGEFVINGRAIEVETSDDLNDIMNKINNLNSGINATGITASILTVSSSNYRLILTSDDTGEDAFTIFDASSDAQNILSDGLGLTDGTTSKKNLISNGVQSEEFSSSTQAVSSMLGISTAQSGTTVSIGSVNNITIDLSKSLTEIASVISTAVSATSMTASVVSSTTDGVTTYRLQIENTTSFTDDNHVLETLGILEGDQGTVDEIHSQTSAVNTDGDAVTAIGTGTTFADIWSNGAASGVAVNDTITITGTDHNGTAVSGSFDPADLQAATVQELLTQIESEFGLGGGSATISGGKIQIQDDTPGDSQLSISLTANNEGGGTLDLGTFTASTEGYTMEVKEGQDANVTIDGTAITSATNTIDDVIQGVTINLLTVESGTTVNLSISRDYDKIKSNVQALLNDYNDVMKDISEQFYYDEDTESGGLLMGDGTLRSIKTDLVNVVTSTLTGLSTDLNALSIIGIYSEIDYADHKNDGQLKMDTDEFMAAIKDDFNGVRRIFVAEGSTTDGDVEYINHSNETVAGTYAVNISQVATQASATGNVDLGSGIGASTIETITITQGTKTAAITLDGASGENGDSIDDIVNAINSELDAEYAQTIIGNIKNTTDAGQTTAISDTTKWDQIYSGGISAGLSNSEVINFSGHKSNGMEVSGSYTISNVATDSVQGLLSAIEAAYDNEVSAYMDSNGYLVVADNTTRNSSMDITITEPATSSLNFGDVTTSNLVGSQRHTTGGGTSAALEGTTLDSIDDFDFVDTEVIKFSGYKANGEAVEGSFTITDVLTDTLGDFLTAINTAFGSDVTEIQDGRIVISEGTSNSTIGLSIFEPSGRTYDMGTLSGGVTGRYSVDITASKDANDYLVLTHDDYGSGSTLTISQSRDSSDTNYKQIIYTDTSNTTDASDGDIYIDSSTTWNDIYGATVSDSESITIAGDDSGGNALVGATYNITDITSDTIGGLLTAIEDAYADLGNTVPTTVEARLENGKIIVEDQTSGTSSITLTLTYNGTGTLDLGTIDKSTERDLDLGLVSGAASGLDVVGTINGESATGSGQSLTGDAPASGETTSVEDLVIKYTGTTTGAQGTIKVTMGVAELFSRELYDITNIIDGYLDYKVESLNNSIDDFDDKIGDMEARLESKMELLIKKFVIMETALSRIQNISNWLAGQLTAASKGWV